MKIEITNPCSSKFQDFEKTEQGGFCQSCQTEVIDFSTKSDEEIFDFFLKAKGKVCGRLPAKELNLEVTPPQLPKRGLLAASLSLLSLAFSPEVNSQNDSSGSEVALSGEKGASQENSDEFFWTVSGRLLQRGCNEPIESGKISLKGGVAKTVSDVDGHFELLIMASTEQTEYIEIDFHFNGMAPVTKTIYRPAGAMNLGDVHLSCDNATPDKVIVVVGTVLEAETNEPIFGVNVVVSDTTIGTVTDFDGNFELRIPSETLALGKQSIQFSYVGYEKNEVEFSRNIEMQDLGEICLNEQEGLIMMVGGITATKQQPVIGRIKRFFRFGIKRRH